MKMKMKMMILLSIVLFAALMLNTSCASTGQDDVGKEALAPPETYVFPDNVPQSGHNAGSYTKDEIITAYSPDGSRFATGFRDEIKIWDSETYRVQVVIERKGKPKETLQKLKWSNDGRFVLSLNGWGILSRSGGFAAEVWDSYTGQHITSLTTSSSHFRDTAALSGDGKYVLLVEDQSSLHIKNIATGETKEVKVRESGNVYYDIRSMTTGPAGTDTVLIGFHKNEYIGSYTITDRRGEYPETRHDHSIVLEEGYRLYSAKKGWTGDVFDAPVAPVIYENRRWDYFSQFNPKDAAFSPDGKSFVVSLKYYTYDDDITIEQKAILYNRTSKKSMRDFRIFTGKVGQMRFSPDGKQLLVYSDNNEVNIFDVATGKQLDVVDLSERLKQVIRK